MLPQFEDHNQFIASLSLLFPQETIDEKAIREEFQKLAENGRTPTHADAFSLVLKFSPFGSKLEGKTEIFGDGKTKGSTEELYTEFYKTLKKGETTRDVSTTFNDENRHAMIQKYFDNSQSEADFQGTWTIDDLTLTPENEGKFRGLTSISQLKDFLTKVFRQALTYEK